MTGPSVMDRFVVCSTFLNGRIGPEPDSRAGGEGAQGERGDRAQEGDPFVNGSFFK